MLWSSVTAYLIFTEIFQHLLQFIQKIISQDQCVSWGRIKPVLGRAPVVLVACLLSSLFIKKKAKKKQKNPLICKYVKNSCKCEPNAMQFPETTRNLRVLWSVWFPLSVLMDRSFEDPNIPVISLLFDCKAEPWFTIYDAENKRMLTIHFPIRSNSSMCCCCPRCSVISLALQSLKIACVGGYSAATCYCCFIRELFLKTDVL